jgi:hypothetical protein
MTSRGGAVVRRRRERRERGEEGGCRYKRELVQKGLPCKAGGCWVIETRIREKGDVPVWIFWREVEPNGIT